MTLLRVAVAIAADLVLLIVGGRTNVLRNGSSNGGSRAAYEPARCVVAWWILLAIGVHTVLSIVTSQAPSFDGPIAGVAAIALVTAIVVWAAGGQGTTTRGFLRDLVSDRGEVALNTFQFVTWNGIVGLMLASTALRQAHVPQVGWRLVLMMAINAASYAIFRVSRLGAAAGSSN